MLKNRAFILDVVTSALIVLVTITEAPLVHGAALGWYVSIRGVLIALLVGHALLYKHIDKIWYGVAWVSIWYVYSATGEYFRPLYIISLFQFQAIHAVYFRHSRRSFFITHIVGTAIFLGVMIHVWDLNIVRLQAAEIQDQLSIAFCALTSATFLYFYFDSVKRRAEAATNKLALVGSYATSLIHDIKNLSAAPLLYAEMLNDESRELSKSDVTKVANLLHTDLTKLEHLVKDLYDTSKPEDILERCSLREACEFATRVLGSRLSGVDLEITGDGTVETNRRILNVILLNLFYNALDAFKKLEHSERRIVEIQIESQRLNFVSHSLSSNQNRTHDAQKKAGLGLYLIEELGKQSNVMVTKRVEDQKWITELRFDS